jgi:hypothetical protein
LSRTSHLIGGALILGGGFLIGYRAGAEARLHQVLSVLNGFVNAIPFIPGLVDQITTTEWFLGTGLVLIVIGLVLVVTGGSGKPKGTKQPDKKPAAPPATARAPGTCKFCGADLKGSKTYCPSCGRSQT